MPYTLKRLLDQDLAGWKMRELRYLTTKSDTGGAYPAVLSRIPRAIICLDQSVLRDVGLLLPPQAFDVVTTVPLVNESEGVFFPPRFLYDPDCAEAEALRIFTRRMFEDAVKKQIPEESPFKWTPGPEPIIIDRTLYEAALARDLG